MELVCLGSSSSGNCYILIGLGDALIIEAGIGEREVLRSLDYKITKVAGVLVSHRHEDHARYIRQFAERGIAVYALEDVFSHYDVATCPFCKRILPDRGFKTGNFKVLPVLVHHSDMMGDIVPCCAFVISHDEMGRLLFITDSNGDGIPKVIGLDHLMIEANCSNDILRANIDAGVEPIAKAKRLPDSHMELNTCVSLIDRQDSSTLKEIILLHLSQTNASEYAFRKVVQEAFGIPVYVAKEGLRIDLE